MLHLIKSKPVRTADSIGVGGMCKISNGEYDGLLFMRTGVEIAGTASFVCISSDTHRKIPENVGHTVVVDVNCEIVFVEVIEAMVVAEVVPK